MKKIFNLALVLVLIVVLGVACEQPTPTQGPSRGVTTYNQLSVDAGTAAAPSLYFGTDSDTGLYWSSANVLGLAAAGSSVATFSATGVTLGKDVSTRNITGTGTLAMTGATALNGGLSMDTTAFTVADTSGNTVIAGTLTVTSTQTFVGATTHSAAVNMSNAVINNIGNAGTDFDTSGGLTLAGNITATGTLNVTGASTFGAAANMSNFAINNIGNAGTNFGSDGSLTTAQAITATAGGVRATSFWPTASGSATAAVYAMSSDTDTGFWYQGDNIIGITAGGVERGRVTTAGLDISPTLTIQSVAFTGPIKYGYTASLASGSTVTHGFSVAPTVCIITAQDATITATITAIGPTVFTATVGATGPVFWMCGK